MKPANARAPATKVPATKVPGTKVPGTNVTVAKSGAAKPAGSSAAAARKAAIQARSGVERRKPEARRDAGSYPIGKGRKALKGISIYMHPLAKDVLDRIARDQDRSVQELGLEALNLLFLHYGEKPIA